MTGVKYINLNGRKTKDRISVFMVIKNNSKNVSKK
jgi:hypothetical protein